MEPFDNPYISRDEKNVPILTGTVIKVAEIALDHIAYGWNAEEIQRQHPHLTLAQVYCALAYYYAFREEMDRDIADRRKRAEAFRPRLEDPALAQRLRLLKSQKGQA